MGTTTTQRQATATTRQRPDPLRPPDRLRVGYRLVRRRIKPGDVACFWTDTRSPLGKLAGFVSWRIQVRGRSWCNHVGLLDVEGYLQKRVVVIEAKPSGVEINPLSLYLAPGAGGQCPDRLRRPYPGRIYVYRPRWLSVAERLRACDSARAMHLTPYDFIDIARIWLWRMTGRWRGQVTDAQVICSGLVGRALVEGMVPLHPRQNKRLWVPADIVESPHVALKWRIQ